MNQKTFFAVKPGYAQDPVVFARIIKMLKANNCAIYSQIKVQYTYDLAKEHYKLIPEKFRHSASTYLSSAPIIGLILEDNRPNTNRPISFIDHVRNVLGDTRCTIPGTIRYEITHAPDLAENIKKIRAKHLDPVIGIDEISTNVAHASDSEESYIREKQIFDTALAIEAANTNN